MQRREASPLGRREASPSGRREVSPLGNGSEARGDQGHSLTLTDRKRLSLTGVEDVDCFNEQIVVLRTPLGTLSVAGAGLNISQLNLESGRVDIDGEVEALEYSGGKRGGGLLGRLFR